ncbi:putative DUF221 domain protein [Xylona heveae TC161]|uniref:Putative DUF221 domain protein n=1 Tax=Xylona heveae (strain CBS 132557 / TC161) TaxID=1328760 RepID=A0A165FM37_XYLHT|nr:putative DUF221 domain protein [Xylona heveae TC161]KZF21141.1 putative DUF221 domain protein [Xylona heveae TC161]
MVSAQGLVARDGTGNQGLDEFLSLISNPFATSLQVNAFWASLVTSVTLTVIIALCFSFLRPYNSWVYAPKVKHADEKHAPPVLGNGVFAWVNPVMTTREASLFDKLGLDAIVFLRFTRMCRDLFLVMSVIGCGIIIPVNVAFSKSPGTGSLADRAFMMMTPQNVVGKPMWAQVIVAWAFDIIIAVVLWFHYRTITRLRRQYFDSTEYQHALHSRTLMLTGIPKAYRTDEGIGRIIDGIKATPEPPRCAIARNVKDLPELIESHDDAVRKLESYLAKYLKNPDKLPPNRPTCRVPKKDNSYKEGQKVDAIDYLTERIRALEAEIKDVRESIDKRNAMPYGFASYQTIPEAHAVAYTARKKHPQGARVGLAPKPNDLIWKNLPLTQKTRRWRGFVNNIWVAVLTLIWVVPNALIAVFLSNLYNLGLVWPGFQKQLYANQRWWAIIQGILSPAITSLFYLLLPTIFRRLSMRAGDLTKTSRERHVMHKLYAFFVFNNLIIFSLFATLWNFVSAVINAKKENQNAWEAIKSGHLFFKVMSALCQVSTYWVTWILQRNLGAAADLAQIWNLSTTWFARKCLSPTPRQLIEWTAPPAFDYASYYNYFLFYATIALCFATLQPIILPVTALYFGIDAWLKKYLLLYVFITKTESGGQFWRVLFNRFLFATVLANVIVALVVVAKGTWIMLICMAPLPILLLGYKIYCNKVFDDRMHYYTKSLSTDAESTLAIPPEIAAKNARKNERLAVRFGHPVLYKPLITPMVHAKAQHMLSQIYSGRLDQDSDTASVAGYSDIFMQNMTQGHPGKSANAAAPFEVVPENHLDFSYYKNRDEFGDEHGGGEIFGRPIDAVSIRSPTPRSFFAFEDRPGSPASSSRASSPAPSRLQRAMSGDTAGYSRPPLEHRSSSSESREGLGSSGYVDLGDPGRVAMYRDSNESETRLLNAAASSPRSNPRVQEFSHDRSGSPRGYPRGYGNVPQDEMDLSYDSYRRGYR